ncbi:MAG: inositol monophosphatase family protein [Candidatus Omnitrophota bacterium]|nr:inositol monophosphatase family protein [Candidatus Omnitrophota bacterium]
MKEMEEIRKVAEKAAREAGTYILSHIGKRKEITHKDGINNLVTDVDLTSERMIIERIKKEFPSHSILAEESGEDKKDDAFRWVIDPLDGTTNYSHGFPFFCVSIAVMTAGSIRTGVVYAPSQDEFFTAEEGKGAFLNGDRIKVSDRGSVKDSLIATGFAYGVQGKIANLRSFEIMLKNAQAVRRAGSAAMDLCYVACGRFDGFWEIGLSPWDTAAGQLIVKEAGGRVTTLCGEPFDIFRKRILATNGEIHKEMIKLLEVE